MRAVRKMGARMRSGVMRSLVGVAVAVLLRPVVNAQTIEGLSDVMDRRD